MDCFDDNCIVDEIFGLKVTSADGGLLRCNYRSTFLLYLWGKVLAGDI